MINPSNNHPIPFFGTLCSTSMHGLVGVICNNTVSGLYLLACGMFLSLWMGDMKWVASSGVHVYRVYGIIVAVGSEEASCPNEVE